MEGCKYVTAEIYEKVRAYREEFHRYPERAWTEYRTSWRIAKRLRQLGFEVFVGEDVCGVNARMGVPSPEWLRPYEERARDEGMPPDILEKMRGGHTGVVGVLRGCLEESKKRAPVVAFRFDIDALPITEEQTAYNAQYRSIYDGVMHACGHDGHAAVGLGVAEVLSRYRTEWRGEVRLIFQPAEEGCHGAAAIVEKGWLDGVDTLLSGHIGIGCRHLGEISACTKGFLATTKLDFYFRGKSAHAGKAPEKGRNALLSAARFTVDAYGLVDGRDDVKLNVGKFVSGSGRNIIAADAHLEAETRGITQLKNHELREKMIEVARRAGQLYGVSVDVEIIGEAGTAGSSPGLVKRCSACAANMGIAGMFQEEADFGASEDVTIMMERVQSQGGEAAFFMFGTPLKAEHHHGAFDFDEKVLEIMTEFYVRFLLG